MAGLLKQIQKSKGEESSPLQRVVAQDRIERASEVVVLNNKHKPTDHGEANASGKSNGLDTADLLLEEMLSEPAESESLDAVVRGKVDRKSVVLRRDDAQQPKKALASVDAAPWWLNEDKEVNPQVEVVVRAASRILLTESSTIPSAEGFVDWVRRAVALAVDQNKQGLRLTRKVIEQSEIELVEIVKGKGPIGPLYEDEAITDIFIDGSQSVKVVRRGHAMETPFCFRCAEEYELFVRCLLHGAACSLSAENPIVDCVLEDAWRSRISAVHGSIAEGGESRLCIRVPRLQKIAFFDILQTKTLPATLAAWLTDVVANGETNVLVVGPVGSGKTVMTTALLSAVSSDQRIISIEDVPEIFVPTIHLEKLLTRPANAKGDGEVTTDALVRAALRRAPHRIVLGDLSDQDARAYLRVLEAGLSGSFATIHAQSCHDALWRMLDFLCCSENAPQESVMRRISRSVHLVLTMRQVKGSPCMVELAEVQTPSENTFKTLPLVRFSGVRDGKREWEMCAADSFWMRRLRGRGSELRPGPRLRPLEANKAGKDS